MSGRYGTNWITIGRDWLDGWAWAARTIAFCCALVLLLALVAPRDLARTSWSVGGSDRALVDSQAGYAFNDSPAGYVGLVSFCGLVALTFLLVATWSRRARVAGAVLAVVAFGFGAWVAVNYARNLANGIGGLDGDLDPGSPPMGAVDAPELLPLFVLVAVVGALAALALAGANDAWPRRGECADLLTPPWLAGAGADAAQLDRPVMHSKRGA
jgi:hypothetical protein